MSAYGTRRASPLAVCEQRDVKGLYKKARSGQLPNMTGISSPYEVPLAPQITIDGGNASVEEGVRQLLGHLDRAVGGTP